jgi:hypothetical protein
MEIREKCYNDDWERMQEKVKYIINQTDSRSNE